MSLPFVQGDTGPALESVIHERGNPDNPLDLTGCTVRFQMRKADDRRFTVNNSATVVDAAEGRVRYQWGPNDLAVHGDYDIQWEVTFPDARRQTTADTETLVVRRQ